MYGHYGHYGYDGRFGDWVKKKQKQAATLADKATGGRISGTLDALKKKTQKSQKKSQPKSLITKSGKGSSQIQAQAQAYIQQAGSLPKALKDFILSGTDLSEVSLREMYAGLSLPKMREDLRSAKAFKIGLIKARNDIVALSTTHSGKVLQSILDQTLPEMDEQITYVDNYIRLMEPYIEERNFAEKDAKADARAVERGYQNAEEALAIREVELEWYFKTYGVNDPIEVAAYQRIERKKYGTTSYEAALAGQQLIPIGSLAQAEVRQEASLEADQMSSDVAVANEEEAKEKQKQMLLYGGVALAGLGLFFYLRSK